MRNQANMFIIFTRLEGIIDISGIIGERIIMITASIFF